MVTILKDKIVVIKKERQCFCCYRKFPIGTRMNYWATIYEGDFGTGYNCLTCKEIISKKYENEYPEGYVQDCLSKGQTPEDYLKEVDEYLKEVKLRKNKNNQS